MSVNEYKVEIIVSGIDYKDINTKIFMLTDMLHNHKH
jgi:hypothetical protein